MIHTKSPPEEVVHYVAQMENLLLSKDELEKINKILSLSNIVEDDAIKSLIAEDLHDEQWIKDTKILINTCKKKIEKDAILKKHLDECRNFIVFRFLEEKTLRTELEIYKQISGWNFNEVNSSGEKLKWISQKFLRSLDVSSIQRDLDNILSQNNVLKINLKWLHQHKEMFFTENLFMPIKSET